MNKTNPSYEQSIHNMGRIFAAVALILILGVPVAICLRYNVLPPWGTLLLNP